MDAFDQLVTCVAPDWAWSDSLGPSRPLSFAGATLAIRECRGSIALAAPHDGIEEPEVLRRLDGSSVYTVAGADPYTSQRILDAEQRLLTAAGRRDGSAVDQVAVDLALLEMAANGSALDAGQPSLVLQMCTSGLFPACDRSRRRRQNHRCARSRPGLDPRDGGHVIGLAPSAAPAEAIRAWRGVRALASGA
jgi:hypothetical protein